MFNPLLAPYLRKDDYEVRLEAGFISRLSLLEHPVLKDLLILRLRQQTNYLIPPEHANELLSLWNFSYNPTEDELDSDDIEKLLILKYQKLRKSKLLSLELVNPLLKRLY